MSKQIGIPKGTRDLTADILAQRNYITKIIKKQFEQFCFEPIETPSFENSETLFGNYGEEGDSLIFKILNSGNYLSKVEDKVYNDKNSKNLSKYISEKALRYDLTVPLSRFVATNQHLLAFPFKRYQMQAVWRADRPQKGRFREFHQCDADVIGSTSLLQEVELLQLYDAVFTELHLPTQLNVNNRKLLYGICEAFGISHLFNDFSVSLDKIHKIGKEKVADELQSKGLDNETCSTILDIVLFEGNNDEKIAMLKEKLAPSPKGQEGLSELIFVLKTIKKMNLQTVEISLDLSLARGLHYYTGCIFEIMAKGVELGSIGGGGRYDNLTEKFGGKKLGGVGISFGLDRIYIALEQLNLFPKTILSNNDVLFLNFGGKESLCSLHVINKLRKKSINATLYPDSIKVKKQFDYANKKGTGFVGIIGEEEMNNNNITIKNMTNGKQISFHENDIAEMGSFLKAT